MAIIAREERKDRPQRRVPAAVLEHVEAVGERRRRRDGRRSQRSVAGPRRGPRATMFSLRVSSQRTGRPTRWASNGEQQLLGVAADLRRRSRRRRRGRSPAPGPGPGRRWRAARRARRGRAGCCTTARAGRRPTRPRRRAPSSGTAAKRWFSTSGCTTTSQPSKKSSVRPKAEVDAMFCRRPRGRGPRRLDATRRGRRRPAAARTRPTPSPPRRRPARVAR